MNVLFATERPDAGCVVAFDKFFEKDRFEFLFGNELGKRGQRYRFGIIDANGQLQVDCDVHGTPRVDTRGVPCTEESVTTEL